MRTSPHARHSNVLGDEEGRTQGEAAPLAVQQGGVPHVPLRMCVQLHTVIAASNMACRGVLQRARHVSRAAFMCLQCTTAG